MADATVPQAYTHVQPQPYSVRMLRKYCVRGAEESVSANLCVASMLYEMYW